MGGLQRRRWPYLTVVVLGAELPTPHAGHAAFVAAAAAEAVGRLEPPRPPVGARKCGTLTGVSAGPGSFSLPRLLLALEVRILSPSD
jgi:hypothetical protein